MILKVKGRLEEMMIQVAPSLVAGKVADMSATRRRQAQMSPILAKKCMSGRHELVTDTRFSCRGFPTLVSTKNLRNNNNNNNKGALPDSTHRIETASHGPV